MTTSKLWLLQASAAAQDDTTFYQPNTWTFPLNNVTPFTWDNTPSAFDSYISIPGTVGSTYGIYGISGGVINGTPLTLSPAPGAAGNVKTTFRPDGQYIAVVGISGSPTYRRNGDAFASSSIGMHPTAVANRISWSADGSVFASSDGSGTGSRFGVQQTNTNTYTLSNQLAAALCCAITPDGVYAAFGRSSTGVIIYKLGGTVSAPTGTSLGAPTGNVAADIQDLAWSPDGQYLAVASTSGALNSGLKVYKRTGDTIAALAVTTPTSSGFRGVAWSPDGTLLVAVASSAPLIAVFSRSGDTFTQEPNPATTFSGYSVAFTKDGGTLYIIRNAVPYLKQYSVSGTTLTVMTDPAFQPSAAPSVVTGALTVWPPAFYGP